MTEMAKDIFKQPAELSKLLVQVLGAGRSALEKAAQLIRESEHLYITGIGSSWHAGMAIQSLLDAGGRPACLLDASEFLHFTCLPPESAVIVLSRSGRSVEIVNLLSKANQAGAKIIGITNTPESPLAKNTDVALHLGARFDHFVSVVMYSGLALYGGLLASCVLRNLDEALAGSLAESLQSAEDALNRWSNHIKNSDWFSRDASTYFLARGPSLASCHEARLLWEEAAKAPAAAMTAGGFRHGPQEILKEGLRVGLWIDGQRMREQDLAMAGDIRKLGGKVMLIGQNLPPQAGDLVLQLPGIRPNWQFLIDIIPAQLAAEHLSHVKGVDCDSLQICSYIVESEEGLIR